MQDRSNPPSASLDPLLALAPAAALTLLLLNDFVLKAHLGGPLTGKLSDFAGLFLFTAFWAALLPGRRRTVGAAVALAWIAWKSPLAAPAIEAWNRLTGLTLARVADPTDLVALLVVPLALRPRRTATLPPLTRRAARPVMAALSMFAFAATSIARPFYPIPGAEHRLPLTRTEVLRRLHVLRLDYDDPGVPVPASRAGPDTVTLGLPPGSEAEAAAWHPWLGPTVTFEVADAPGGSAIRALQASGYPLMAPDSVRVHFERRIVDRLRLNEPNPFPPPPLTAGAYERFRPRILGQPSLIRPRGLVTVSLARPAHVALIEVAPDGRWTVIHPVGDAPGILRAGEHTLTTACGPAPPAAGPCAVLPPLLPTDPATPGLRAGRGRSAVARGAGRLILLAADAPLHPAALQALVRSPGFPAGDRVDSPDLQSALGQFVRRGGGSRAAAVEVILRR